MSVGHEKVRGATCIRERVLFRPVLGPQYTVGFNTSIGPTVELYARRHRRRPLKLNEKSLKSHKLTDVSNLDSVLRESRLQVDLATHKGQNILFPFDTNSKRHRLAAAL
jgi:hypothetical protein